MGVVFWMVISMFFLKRGDKLGKSRYDKSIYARINRFVKKPTAVLLKCLFSERKTIYTHNEKVISSFKFLCLHF